MNVESERDEDKKRGNNNKIFSPSSAFKQAENALDKR